MKRTIILLISLLTFCSCDTCELEWWETVNPPAHRLERASGRNDDSKVEQYLFEKAEALEAAVKPYRVPSWVESDNVPLIILGVLTVLLTIGLLILGIIVKYADIMSSWPRIVLAILTSLLSVLAVLQFLFNDVGTKGSTIDIGAILFIVDMILCVPFVITDDENYVYRGAPTGIGTYAYSSILPLAMIIGAFSRVATTYLSYIFLLLIVIYAVSVIIATIRVKESMGRALVTVLYLLVTGFGSVVILYSTMPAMVHFFNDIITLVVAWMVLSGYSSGSYSSPKNTITLSDGTVLTRTTGLTGEEILTGNDGHDYKRNPDRTFSKK